MVTVVFHFTDWDEYPGGNLPKSTMNVWVHDVRAFGADRIIMIDKTSFKIGQYWQHNDESIIFERYNSLEECLDKYKNEIWIFADINDKSKSLIDFEHPKDCFYVVGADFSRILNESNIEPDHWIKIPMLHYRPLYAHVAMMVMLYDRMIKIK